MSLDYSRMKAINLWLLSLGWAQLNSLPALTTRVQVNHQEFLSCCPMHMDTVLKTAEIISDMCQKTKSLITQQG